MVNPENRDRLRNFEKLDDSISERKGKKAEKEMSPVQGRNNGEPHCSFSNKKKSKCAGLVKEDRYSILPISFVRVEAAVMSVCEFELVARPSVTLDADLVAFGLSAQVTVHNRDCMAF